MKLNDTFPIIVPLNGFEVGLIRILLFWILFFYIQFLPLTLS